jgi:hypothetical protein
MGLEIEAHVTIANIQAWQPCLDFLISWYYHARM